MWHINKYPFSRSDSLEINGIQLPAIYVSFLSSIGPGEGHVGGDSYLRLYDIQILQYLNDQYHISEFLPGTILIGTDCGDTAYGLTTTGKSHKIITFPFVPMSQKYIETEYKLQSFIEFVLGKPTEGLLPNKEIYGTQLWWIIPIFVGGDPNLGSNVVIIPLEEHFKVCSYWNDRLKKEFPETYNLQKPNS